MKPSEVIQQRGWIQGRFETPRGVCVRGAAQIACHGEVIPSAGCGDRCARLTLKLTGVVGGGLATLWNDAPGRTAQQVIALLQEFETEFTSESEAVEVEERDAILV